MWEADISTAGQKQNKGRIGLLDVKENLCLWSHFMCEGNFLQSNGFYVFSIFFFIDVRIFQACPIDYFNAFHLDLNLTFIEELLKNKVSK